MANKIKNKLLWSSEEKLLLGENPLWDASTNSLFLIDAADPAVYRLTGGEFKRFAMPKPVASIFLSDANRLIVAMRSTFAELNLLDGRLSDVALVVPPTSEERFNDGRCDAQGRIWISTMDRQLQSGIGSIMQINAQYNSKSFKTSAKLGNGVCFSPDGKWLYFSDTTQRAIFRFPLAEPGAMEAGRELFAQLDEAPGRPDGCSIDTEGCLWSARVGGGRIDRYAPDGTLLGYLETPVTHPTHCTFGGPDMRTLFVTSSRYPVSSREFDQQPHAGKVLAFEVPVKGLEEARFHSAARELSA